MRLAAVLTDLDGTLLDHGVPGADACLTTEGPGRRGTLVVPPAVRNGVDLGELIPRLARGDAPPEGP